MTYLVASYTAVWLGLFVYLVSLSRRQKRLDREIDSLRRVVEERKK